MSHSRNDARVYRDGLDPLLSEYMARLGRVSERARALDTEARADLAAPRRRELEEAEALLATSPSTREELETAEAVLDAYEKYVDSALSEIGDVREKRLLAAQLRPRLRRKVIIIVAGLSVVMAGLVVWGRRVDQRELRRRHEAYSAECRRRPECAARGLCGAPPPEKRDATRGCHAVADDDCSASAECREEGKCAADNGVCRAITRRDCEQSNACRERGECSPDQGACRVLTEADCEGSSACSLRGLCSAERGICRALSSAGCRRSHACWMDGECSADHGVCRALALADCAQSQACLKRGACAPRDGKCVASDDGCRATDECKHLGQCSAVGSVCAPRRPEDCGQSEICKVRGLCASPVVGAPPQCRPSVEGCRASSQCRDGGYCTASFDECILASASDCQGTAMCKKDGYCTPRQFGGVTVCGPREGPMEGRWR